MTNLQELLEAAVRDGSVPGATALVARGETVETAAAGELERGSIVRIASLTKPITAAAVMLLVDEGRLALDDPIATWLPELAAPQVVRTPASPLDDLVPAARPITVEDVLTFRRASEPHRRSSPPGPVASSRRSPTGTASGACCSRAAAGSCRGSPCA